MPKNGVTLRLTGGEKAWGGGVGKSREKSAGVFFLDLCREERSWRWETESKERDIGTLIARERDP